jgi:DNA-binding response OmpR family regulator
MKILTAKEFSLLEYFMRNSGRVLARIDTAEKVVSRGELYK